VIASTIASQVVRLFPYIGNVPMVRWRAAIAGGPRRSAARQPSR
jgi:hypothetical protein